MLGPRARLERAPLPRDPDRVRSLFQSRPPSSRLGPTHPNLDGSVRAGRCWASRLFPGARRASLRLPKSSMSHDCLVLAEWSCQVARTITETLHKTGEGAAPL